MIYFAIELKYHDFSKSEYMRTAYNRKTIIDKNYHKGLNRVFSLTGFSDIPEDPEILKYILVGDFYITEPYSEEK